METKDFDYLEPFWCLMAYDQLGRRMYAYGPGGVYEPGNHYPSTIGALTHRPREARRFASAAEAEAALPDLAPWVERYVADRVREDERDEREARRRKKEE